MKSKKDPKHNWLEIKTYSIFFGLWWRVKKGQTDNWLQTLKEWKMGFAFSFLIKGDYQNEFEKPLDLYVNVLVYISNTKKKNVVEC